MEPVTKRVAVVHYGEIAVKGKNRVLFERRLKGNLQRVADGMRAGPAYRRPGRLEVFIPDHCDVPVLLERLRQQPGVVWVMAADAVARDLDVLTARAVEVAVAEAAPADAPYAVRARRSDKSFPMGSMEVARHGRPVDLTNPHSTYVIEINEDFALVYTQKLAGPGGLPVGISGKVLALLSGGLDSPVAAHLMQRRGAKLAAVHFRNETLAGGPAVEAKIRDLCGVLARPQGKLALYMVPFGDLQRLIIAHVPDRYRMLIYRRVMMRIGDQLRDRERAGALVTGDSLGQVASQTLENIQVIYDACRPPVFAPLIGSDKTDITAIAR
ncbi:MAG: tRNA uracil 4-sulfurtransferase ThiI, partial [Planctomycetota bacterium]